MRGFDLLESEDVDVAHHVCAVLFFEGLFTGGVDKAVCCWFGVCFSFGVARSVLDESKAAKRFVCCVAQTLFAVYVSFCPTWNGSVVRCASTLGCD